MKMIGDDTGLIIPKGAKGLNFAYKPPIDPAFLARIEIPAESRQSMETQLTALQDKPVQVIGGLTTRIPWWKPTRGKVIVDKQVLYPNGKSLHAILTIEGDTLILYIDWST